MAIQNPQGFIPKGHLHGVVSHRQRLYPTRGSNNHTLMVGDPIHVDSSASRNIQKWPPGTVSAGSTRPIGVIVGLFDANKRPLTHYQPGRNPVIDPTTTAWVAINDDPFSTFNVEYEAPATAAAVGQYVSTTVNVGNTALGRSGMKITADLTASASISHPFQIIGIADQEDDAITSGASANNDIEVIIAAHGRMSNAPA